MIYFYLLLLFCINCYAKENENNFCSKEHQECNNNFNSYKDITYIFYDVNSPEGFNLRRDVYIRMATFVNTLNKSKNKKYVLVLPPWSNLFHWKSNNINQNLIFWEEFFDINSLKMYTHIIEMKDYMSYYNTWRKQKPLIEEIYILKHFEEMFETGDFKDKLEYFEECQEKYEPIYFWGYNNITHGTISCIKFQGPANLLKSIVLKSKSSSIMFVHAEIPLHDTWGSSEFWRARRSMRFSNKLVNIADKFREAFLNSTNIKDNTKRPLSWKDEIYQRKAQGGNYVSVHLRRSDFLWGRAGYIPSILYAAKQIQNVCNKLKTYTIFLATDAVFREINELKLHLEPKIKVVMFQPDSDTKSSIKDGGIAIVEQIICSYAKYFIGTYESTYSFRIQEEREIIGFPKTKTFNRLCGDNETDSKCSKTTVWSIIF